MDKELVAALIGGVVGVMGSLASVAMGYLLQAKSARRQFEEERALHKQQIDNERAIHLEQIANQRALIDESIKRENNLRVADMLMRDIKMLAEDLQTPNLQPHEAQEINKQITLYRRNRERLLQEIGIDLVRP